MSPDPYACKGSEQASADCAEETNSTKTETHRAHDSQFRAAQLAMSNTKNFSLLDPDHRLSLLDDLLQFDRCHFHTTYGVDLPTQKPSEQSSFLARIKNKIFSEISRCKWDEITTSMKENRESDYLSGIKNNLTAAGIPHRHRFLIWKYLIGN